MPDLPATRLIIRHHMIVLHGRPGTRRAHRTGIAAGLLGAALALATPTLPAAAAAASGTVPAAQERQAQETVREVSPPVARAIEALKAGDRQRAAAFLRPAAESGDGDAQALLGQLYLEGGGPKRDLFEAGKWLRAAAANGQAEGTYLLAVATAQGVLTPPGIDPEDAAAREAEATRLYRAAAIAGSTPAQLAVGLRYARGQGVSRDVVEAGRWFRQAAEAGDADAAFNLGVLHASGALSPAVPDHAAARRWFEAAAEKGHAGARYNLGLMEVEGLAGPADPQAALRWFEAAAAQGLAEARAALAWMLHQGLGTARDEARAVALYRQAAAQGHGPARAQLARLHAAGRGVMRDPAEAWMWLELARQAGHEDPELEERLRALTGPETRAEGRRRAQAWQDRNPDGPAPPSPAPPPGAP